MNIDLLPQGSEPGEETEEADNGDLLRILEDELRDAEDYSDLIDPDRAKALDYYLGRPMGDEREGRSKVISSEVYKVVEGMSTAIANIFVGAKSAVEFVPRQAEDVEKAEQQTSGVEYVFYTQNDGFLVLVEMVKDGILSKTGILTWRHEKQRKVTVERYKDLDDASIGLIMADPNVTIIEKTVTRQEPQTDEQGQPALDQMGQSVVDSFYDVTLRVVSAKGQCVIECVPPEEVKVSSRTRSSSIQKSPCVIWSTEKTKHELMQCGYDEETLELLNFTGSSGGSSRNSSVLQRTIDETQTQDGTATIHTAWITRDIDGDGIVELRRVVWSDTTVLENEITDEINLSAWTPNIQPHEFYGRCPADDAIEGQEVMTVVKRQGLDNLYWANNQQLRVDDSDSRVNIADYYNPEIGRIVRGPAGSVEVLQVPVVLQHSMTMLEYEQSDQENKTGFTRYSQGLDAKSLNQTAHGISVITNMSQQRVQLMARICGELGVKPMMRGVAKLLKQHGDKALMFKLNGKFVQTDPREWATELDMMVNIGLGVTDKDQQLVHLNATAQAQMMAMQAGLPIVDPKMIYNVQAKILENTGFRDPAFAFIDPATLPPPEPQPPPPDPAMEKVKAQVAADQAKMQSDQQMQQQKMAFDQQLAQQKMQMDQELEIFKANLQAETQKYIAGIKAQADAQRPVVMGMQ